MIKETLWHEFYFSVVFFLSEILRETFPFILLIHTLMAETKMRFCFIGFFLARHLFVFFFRIIENKGDRRID